MSALTLWRNTTLATLSANDWGVIEKGALISRGDTIVWLGKATQIPRELTADITEEHDLQGKLLTPGLVDCHTHLVYGGQRANEFEMRLQGVAYEDIARAGGGSYLPSMLRGRPAKHNCLNWRCSDYKTGCVKASVRWKSNRVMA